jgi:hypothetical protein
MRQARYGRGYRLDQKEVAHLLGVRCHDHKVDAEEVYYRSSSQKHFDIPHILLVTWLVLEQVEMLELPKLQTYFHSWQPS